MNLIRKFQKKSKKIKKNIAFILACTLTTPSVLGLYSMEIFSESIYAKSFDAADGVMQEKLNKDNLITVSNVFDLDELASSIAKTMINNTNTLSGSNHTAGQMVDDGSNNSSNNELETIVSASKDSYKFNNNNLDSDLYDEDAKFTFYDNDGVAHDYTGVYKGNVKKDNNTDLKLSDVGSLENPYIILEISPSAAISEIRPHVGEAGFGDLSNEQVSAIHLTTDDEMKKKYGDSYSENLHISEETTVRINLVERMYENYYSRVFDLDIIAAVLKYKDTIKEKVEAVEESQRLTVFKELISKEAFDKAVEWALNEKKEQLAEEAGKYADEAGLTENARLNKIIEYYTSLGYNYHNQDGILTKILSYAQQAADEAGHTESAREEFLISYYQNHGFDYHDQSGVVNVIAKKASDYADAAGLSLTAIQEKVNEYYTKLGCDSSWDGSMLQNYFIAVAQEYAAENNISINPYYPVGDYATCLNQKYNVAFFDGWGLSIGGETALQNSLQNAASNYASAAGFTEQARQQKIEEYYRNNGYSYGEWNSDTVNINKIVNAANSAADAAGHTENARTEFLEKYYNELGYDYNNQEAIKTIILSEAEEYADKAGFTVDARENKINEYYHNLGLTNGLDDVELSVEEIAVVREEIEENYKDIFTKYDEMLLKGVPDETEYAKEIYGISNWNSYYSVYTKRTAVVDVLNGRGTKTIAECLTELEEELIKKGAVSKDDYEALLDRKYDEALQYKIDYEKSVSYGAIYNLANYSYDYDFKREYEVEEDGTFKVYNGGEQRNYKFANNHVKTNALYGEYGLTTDVYNPLATVASAITGGSYNSGGNEFLISDYTFRKSCLNLAYKSQLGENGTIESQEISVDEYIFAGWMVDLDKDGVPETAIESKRFTDEQLKDIDTLYTNWIVRYYDSQVFQQLNVNSYVKIDMGDYNICIPASIASNTNRNAAFHDARNQLSFCTPVKTNAVIFNANYDSKWGNVPVVYAEEISAWDFDFSKEKYSTVESLKQVAPKLMADTDYYVKTYNTSLETDKETGRTYIEYSPYNVQVITITPEELNKMVYYDYANHYGEAGWYNDGKLIYHESERLDEFINNVDFIYFSNGGETVYFKNDNEIQYTYRDIHTHTATKITREPVVSRVPELCNYDENTKSWIFDKTKVVSSASFTGGVASDLEWQVVYKIYTRTGDQKQGRRVAVVVNEALSDQYLGKSGSTKQLKKMTSDTEWEYINGSEDNLCKLLLMYFAYVDPTRIYDLYVNPKYTVDGKNFDKMKGGLRTENAGVPYKNSWFTGYLYDYEKWNMALFLPFELFDENHFTILTAQMSGKEDHYAQYDPTINGGSYITLDKAYWYFPELGVWYPFEYDENHVPHEVLEDGTLDSADLRHKFTNGVGSYYNSYAAQSVSTPSLGMQIYNALGLVTNADCKNIANPYAYTFNGGTDLAGGFFTYNRGEVHSIDNSVNYAGNTFLAFEYFRKVRPTEIHNDMIATKSAIEFMVQNAQNGIVSFDDKKITILNAEPIKNVFYKNGVRFEVEKVQAAELGDIFANVEYQFTGSTNKGSVLVVEYYWTNQFSITDNDNKWGAIHYLNYAVSQNKPMSERWFKMPDSSVAVGKENYFNTYLAENGTQVTNIEKATSYYVNALLKPEINSNLIKGSGIASTSPQYIIVVKEYASMADYQNKKSPVSIISKNVVVSKLSLLFELD